MPCDNKALLKTSQFAVCLGGLLYKVWTSWESQRVALSLQKVSKDWTLRRGFADPTSTDSIFIDLAFGSFTLVTFCLLVGHILGDPRTAAEKLLMVTGFIGMVIVGGLLITSTDDVPERLYDNAVILGMLAFLAGVLFLLDAGTKCQAKKRPPKAKPVIVSVPSRELSIVEVVAKPEREVEEQPTIVIEPRKEEKKEEQKKDKGAKKEETTQTQNGIKSVEIRIKDPTKNWPVYGGGGAVAGAGAANGRSHAKALAAELDALAEAERLDRLLQAVPSPPTSESEAEPVLLRQESSREKTAGAAGSRASLQPGPLRHTSSYYIGGPFSWRRNNEQAKPQ